MFETAWCIQKNGAFSSKTEWNKEYKMKSKKKTTSKNISVPKRKKYWKNEPKRGALFKSNEWNPLRNNKCIRNSIHRLLSSTDMCMYVYAWVRICCYLSNTFLIFNFIDDFVLFFSLFNLASDIDTCWFSVT